MTLPDWSARLADAIAANAVPGAALAFEIDNVMTLASAGVTDIRTRTPVQTSTIFRLGSMTKSFTATLVMQQVAAGRIDLDQPVQDLLPELVLGDAHAAAQVTTRQLLAHSGGFFGDILDGPSEGEDALAAYVAVGKRLEQITPPGSGFSYCNAGFAIAARLVEHVSGELWDKGFNDRIAGPLAMHRTGALLTALPADDVASSHAIGPDGILHAVPLETTGRAMGPAGATAWSTPADILAFARAMRTDGGAILAPAGVVAMRALEVEGPTPTFATGWGLGIQRFDASGDCFGHDGAVAGQNSFLRVVPSRGLSFALCCNGGDARGLFADLFSALENDIGRPLADPVPAWPVPQPVSDPQRYCGRYAVERYAVEVTPHAEGLHACFTPAHDAGDFGAPISLVMRRQPDDPTGTLFLTKLPSSRLPTQQRFFTDPDGRRFLLFRGRLLPEARP